MQGAYPESRILNAGRPTVTTGPSPGSGQQQSDGAPSDYVPYCRACGTPVRWEDSYACERCGITPLCRLHFNSDSRTCGDCAPAQPDAETGPSFTLWPYGRRPTVTCPNCGARIRQIARYCPDCGVEQPPVPVSETDVVSGRNVAAPIESVRGEYVGFWVRLAAWIIDRLITAVISVLLITAFGGSIGVQFAEPPPETLQAPAPEADAAGQGPIVGTVSLSVLVFSWAISVIYHVVLTGWRSQTVGKMLLGILVVNADGNRPGWNQLVMRESVGKLASELPLWLGYFWAGWDGRKRAWHDYLGRTYVVRKPRKTG